ncbi:hypothetical protein BC834DRAFT_968358 [Gloeopeniophorella convolvens]|nr:hypothetical protein BC834DRAFT_968358 [Gloeopeniophorella convolvens]
MLDALVYKKNLVPERQREYQHSHKPIYYRPPRSRLYLGLYKTAFTLGVVGITYSAYSLVKARGFTSLHPLNALIDASCLLLQGKN